MAPRRPVTIGANGEMLELSDEDVLNVSLPVGSGDPNIIADGDLTSGLIVSSTAVGFLLNGSLVFSALDFGGSQFIVLSGLSAVIQFTNAIQMTAGPDGAFNISSEVHCQHSSGSQFRISSAGGGEARHKMDSSGTGSITFETQPTAVNSVYKWFISDGNVGDPIITDGSGVLSFESKSGTSFPLTGLYTGREFYRSDLKKKFTYDGTDWLGPIFTHAFGRAKATNVPGLQSLTMIGNVSVTAGGGYSATSDMKLVGIKMYSDDAAVVSGTLIVRVAGVTVFTRAVVAERSLYDDDLDVDITGVTTGGINVGYTLSAGTIRNATFVIELRERM